MQVDPLTLKVVTESRVMWATSVPILVFLGVSVLDLGPIYVTDRQTLDIRQHHCLTPPPRGWGHNNNQIYIVPHRYHFKTHLFSRSFPP